MCDYSQVRVQRSEVGQIDNHIVFPLCPIRVDTLTSGKTEVVDNRVCQQASLSCSY